MTCVFCDIVDDRAPADVLQVWPDAIAIRPLNPVVDGHLLVLPRRHVADASVDPITTAITARRASMLLRPGYHFGINNGPGAGQTVFHLHMHVWPCVGHRCMPWGCPVGTSTV